MIKFAGNKLCHKDLTLYGALTPNCETDNYSVPLLEHTQYDKWNLVYDNFGWVICDHYLIKTERMNEGILFFKDTCPLIQTQRLVHTELDFFKKLYLHQRHNTVVQGI